MLFVELSACALPGAININPQLTLLFRQIVPLSSGKLMLRDAVNELVPSTLVKPFDPTLSLNASVPAVGDALSVPSNIFAAKVCCAL
jgi:hypothetical protein